MVINELYLCEFEMQMSKYLSLSHHCRFVRALTAFLAEQLHDLWIKILHEQVFRVKEILS